MGINRVINFLVIFIFFTYSCKENIKKDITVSNDIEIQNKGRVSNDELVSLVKKFYTLYLNDFNNQTNTCDLDKYLSEDFYKYLNRLDYNGVIHAQDYEKFDLSTLKVSKTQKNNIYKVEFINMGYETIVFVKLKLINKVYTITNITGDLEEADVDIVLSQLRSHKYDFYKFKYFIEPWGDPRTGISFYVENFDEDMAVLGKGSYDEVFAYLCTKKETGNGLELYYKEPLKYEAYTGDTSKPLITIYKKGEDFYATSPLIEDGKEIKLEEE